MVGSPWVQSTSLTATGSPASRPSGLPALRRRSICLGLGQGRRRIDAQERLDLAVVLLDPVEKRLGQLDRSDFARSRVAAEQFEWPVDRVESASVMIPADARSIVTSPSTAGTR